MWKCYHIPEYWALLLESDLGTAQHDQSFANRWHATTDVKGLQKNKNGKTTKKDAHLVLSADMNVNQASLIAVSEFQLFRK